MNQEFSPGQRLSGTALILFAGIRRIGSAQTALLAPVETLLAVSWAVLFLGDRLPALQWGGGVLILLSMVLVVPRRVRPAMVGEV